MRPCTRAMFVLLIAVLAVGVVHAAKGRIDPLVPGVNGVTHPTVVGESRVAPVFPVGAAMEGIEASVVVSAVVLRDGTVQDLTVLECSAPGYGFEEAVRNAVRRWRFEPGTWNGRAVDTVSKIRVRLSPPLESPAAILRALRVSGLAIAAFPLPGGAHVVGDVGGAVLPALDPGATVNEPTRVARPGCRPGQLGCLYEKQGVVPGEVLDNTLKFPITVPIEQRR